MKTCHFMFLWINYENSLQPSVERTFLDNFCFFWVSEHLGVTADMF